MILKKKERVEVKVSELFDEIGFLRQSLHKPYEQKDELRAMTSRLHAENRALKDQILMGEGKFYF